MSGGSGGYMPEIKSAEETNCYKLSLTTTLTNPVAQVISKLVIGSILEVVKVAPNSLQVFNMNGELAGILLTRDRDRIINCIDSGVDFSAIVLRIVGANCAVLIKAK